MSDNRRQFYIQILQGQQIRWLFLFLFLTTLVTIRFVDHRGFVYGNLGFVSLNKKLSLESSQSRPDLTLAQNFLKNAVADSPTNANYLFALGRMSLIQGNEEMASHYWAQAEPRQIVSSLILWGDQYRKQGKYETAMLWYQLAAHIVPESADPWQRVGLLYLSQEKFTDAEDAYRSGLSKPITYNVGRSDFYFRLGQLQSKDQGYRDWPVVLDLIELALSQGEFSNKFTETQTHYLHGEALRHLGRNQEALLEYQWVIERQPDDYWSHIHRGQLLWIENQDLEAAEISLEAAIGLRPTSKWAYRILADIYQDTKTINRAIDLYEKVLEIDPQDVWSKTELRDLKEDVSPEKTS